MIFVEIDNGGSLRCFRASRVHHVYYSNTTINVYTYDKERVDVHFNHADDAAMAYRKFMKELEDAQ